MYHDLTAVAEMLPVYYKTRGWDENGVPTQKKLKEWDWRR
jgi:aldehyde:ferredoxin oxidoreductase